MTGYQEILTDPSYSGQIVTLTYPHIGNTGVNAEDVEANRVYASGLVVRDCPARVSNFRSTQSLPEYLAEQGIVAISGIDTASSRAFCARRAPRAPASSSAPTPSAPSSWRAASRHGRPGPGPRRVHDRADWTQGTWELGEGYTAPDQSRFHVVAYDFGVKSNILRLLADRGCRITLVPAQTTADEVLKLNPDGVFLSNGPGDPSPATTPSKPPASSWTRSCPCSASAWATRSWAWRWAARPSR